MHLIPRCVCWEGVLKPATFGPASVSVREGSGCARRHARHTALLTTPLCSYDAFSRVPEELAFANNTLYTFINDVGGNDMVEGLYQAVTMFEGE